MPLLLPLFLPLQPVQPAWQDTLREEIRRIDDASPGRLGVFAKEIHGETAMGYEAARPWYLSSVVKLPVAITVLEKVEKGEITLDQLVELGPDDKVDGQGPLLGARPGTKYTVRELLSHMLTRSDSTAADLLIRLVGETAVNESARGHAPGFGTITTLRAVREEAYSEVHPSARQLRSKDFLELKKVPAPKRRDAILRRLKLKKADALAPSVPEAFERYYARGLNSASLEALGAMLEKLGAGRILNPENTELRLGWMQKASTGEKRIKAGLKLGSRFAQKTGTQIARTCAAGIVNEELVLAACIEGFGDSKKAEETLKKVGKAVAKAGLLD